MNKNTKYYFLLKYLLISIILIISFSIVIQLFNLYRYLFPILFDSLIIVSKVLNTVSIIVLIIITLYLIYQIGLYARSNFYKYTQINFFEAIYSGILDIHLVYDSIDRMSDVKELNVDLKKKIISFTKKSKNYCIMFQEMFGRIDAKLSNEMWVQLSKPRKSFGKRYYQNKLKFTNPLRELNRYTVELKSNNNKEYIGYLVISGYYKMELTDERVIAPYEITSVVI